MFNECRNPITKKMLPFDFYLQKSNMCIEFDGRQHFRTGLFSNDLKSMQYRDSLKTEFCKKNNISLLRIHYKDIDKIKDIMNNFCLQ